MQKISNNRMLAVVIFAAAMSAGLILAPALIEQVDAQGKGQAKKTEKVKTEKAKNEKPDNEKVKVDKSKEKEPKSKDGKDKQPKQTRFEVTVDASQVGNATDALLNYEFTVGANGLTSKAKQIDANLTGVDDISNMMLVFNTAGMAVVDGDTFTASATSLNDAYGSDSVTGTFVSENIGNSGKTRIVGTTDEALVLAEAGAETEEQIPDDF
jgi:hypothetical protein